MHRFILKINSRSTFMILVELYSVLARNSILSFFDKYEIIRRQVSVVNFDELQEPD